MLGDDARVTVVMPTAPAWRADVIVLDEPTAGLDVAGRDILSHALAAERAREVRRPRHTGPMMKSFAIRLARRAAVRRIRRLGGTSTVAWALKVPLVTLVVVAALAATASAVLRDPS